MEAWWERGLGERCAADRVQLAVPAGPGEGGRGLEGGERFPVLRWSAASGAAREVRAQRECVGEWTTNSGLCQAAPEEEQVRTPARRLRLQTQSLSALGITRGSCLLGG